MGIIDFTNLDPHDSTRKILACKDLQALMASNVLIEVRIGQIDMAIQGADTEAAVVKYKADKRLSLALMDLLKQRIKHLRDYDGRLNHNFRKRAKNVLPEETYNNIIEQSKPKN